MAIEDLRSNLQNLYKFGKAKRDEGVKLVADPIYKEKIYSSKDLGGRLCLIFYSMVAAFGWDRLRQKNLFLAKQYTYKIFLIHKAEAISSANDYRHYLLRRSSGEEVAEEVLGRIRCELVAWHDTTKVFSKALKDKGFQEKVARFDRKIVNKLLEEKKSFNQLFRIVKLEGILKKTLPVALIIKAATPQMALNEVEKCSLQKFARKINRVSDLCDLHFLDASLLALMNELKSANESLNVDVGALEISLIEHGCQVFSSQDVPHIKKREQISCGNKVLLGDKAYIVGKCLSEENDSTHVYELINSQYLLNIGPSRAYLHMKKFVSQNRGWAVPLFETLVDPKGRFSLVEKLHMPIKNYSWSSVAGTISSEDCSVATPLMNLCKWCIEQNKFPLNLSAENLMFNSNSCLRTLKICTEGQFDFNKMVDLISDLSGGNQVVNTFILKESGLLDSDSR